MLVNNAALRASFVIATLSGANTALAQHYQYGDYPLRPIQFPVGKSSAMVHDSVERGAGATYSFAAREGQKAVVRFSSVEDNALFSIYLPGRRRKKGDGGIDVEGAKLPGADARTGASKWSGVLPKTGAYIVTVAPTRGGATYELNLWIQQSHERAPSPSAGSESQRRAFNPWLTGIATSDAIR
jgi:hypothetical protein